MSHLCVSGLQCLNRSFCRGKGTHLRGGGSTDDTGRNNIFGGLEGAARAGVEADGIKGGSSWKNTERNPFPVPSHPTDLFQFLTLFETPHFSKPPNLHLTTLSPSSVIKALLTPSTHQSPNPLETHFLPSRTSSSVTLANLDFATAKKIYFALSLMVENFILPTLLGTAWWKLLACTLAISSCSQPLEHFCAFRFAVLTCNIVRVP